MKKNRHKLILELIKTGEIDTQEELLRRLKAAGMEATQATVSRDIRELGLIKLQNSAGGYVYAAPDKDTAGNPENVFKSSVKSIDYALNTIVIKCYIGMAGAAAAVFDAMKFDNVLGSIAGDDTIIVIVKTEAAAASLTAKLKEIM